MKLFERQIRISVRVGLTLLLGAISFGLTGCGPKEGHSPAGSGQSRPLYTCGMHPQVVQDQPGNCPICGMKLTPVRSQGEPGGVASQAIEIDPATTQNMGIRTALVTRGPLRRHIRTVGMIDYNETALADVTTKFKGWIEKLYVDATGQQVHRGEPLFEIYSPELYSAQQEYVLSLAGGTNHPGAASLQSSAITKLRFFDISEAQIAELERSRQPRKTLQVTSPQDGFVMEKMIIEGQMVDPGMRLYRLADLGLVWVQAQIYEQDLAYIHLGQEAMVTLSYLPDREFRGRVTYVYPNIDEKTRTARVRMEFHNPGYFLKPGMFATVEVTSQLEPTALLVPDMAILRSGEKNTVFVETSRGRFEARIVVLGPQAEDDYYAVISGLNEGERIVTSGQFMLDSESQLREAIQKMASAGSPAPTPGEASPGKGPPPTPQAPTPAANVDVKYICPMPEHVSIQYDHPGKCSICAMTLVPVGGAMLAKLQPGGKLLYFTCPMPEHGDVRAERPGKCPKCGMTLIPVMEPPPIAVASTNLALPTVASILYTCPMASDADVVTDKPGKCPRCEMDLVPTATVPHGKVAEANWRAKHEALAPPSHQH